MLELLIALRERVLSLFCVFTGRADGPIQVGEGFCSGTRVATGLLGCDSGLFATLCEHLGLVAFVAFVAFVSSLCSLCEQLREQLCEHFYGEKLVCLCDWRCVPNTLTSSFRSYPPELEPLITSGDSV